MQKDKQLVIEVDIKSGKGQGTGQKERYELHKYAELADVSIMQYIGGSAILCTICIDYESECKEDFLPLSVQYIEKMYAIGKIPQGFIKREGKPSDSEILTSRLIDRSIRALMPKDFPYTTQVTLMALSYDGKSDLQKDATNLASIALFLSSIPLKNKKILAASRVLEINNKFKVTQDINEILESRLDLFASGFNSSITMIEMQRLKAQNENKDSNTIPKDKLLKALNLAKSDIDSKSKIYTQAFKNYQQKKYKLNINKIDSNLSKNLSKKYAKQIKNALISMSKSERQTQIKSLIESISNAESMPKEIISPHIFHIKREIMREMILSKGKRADNRTLSEIRKISIESNILPHTHGSALFTRGQTQALVTCTLGSESEAQSKEGLMPQYKSNVMFHYNFPPFCVGEAYPILAQSRRELGHGNLALKAIESSIKKTPFSIRLVSEILSSNGSSSMASVCGASLALKVAGVELSEMIAGIAIGLIYESKQKYAILSDIMGLEDFDGDMDFKVAGSRSGVSALQLDLKLDSISIDILGECLDRAIAGIDSILSVMEGVEIRQNDDVLPKSDSFSVPPGSLRDIIGQGGRVIKDIIARFNIGVNLDKEKNIVTLTGTKSDSIKGAREFINEILKQRLDEFRVGSVYNGTIKKHTQKGIIVEIAPGVCGIIETQTLEHLESKEQSLGKKQTIEIEEPLERKERPMETKEPLERKERPIESNEKSIENNEKPVLSAPHLSKIGSLVRVKIIHSTNGNITLSVL